MLQWGVQLHSRSDGVFVREGVREGPGSRIMHYSSFHSSCMGTLRRDRSCHKKGMDACMQCSACRDAATDDAGIAHRTSSPPPSLSPSIHFKGHLPPYLNDSSHSAENKRYFHADGPQRGSIATTYPLRVGRPFLPCNIT